MLIHPTNLNVQAGGLLLSPWMLSPRWPELSADPRADDRQTSGQVILGVKYRRFCVWNEF